MSRIVSVWLPRWPILRLIAAQARSSASQAQAPVDPEQPFVLAVDASGGPRIAATNAAAEAEGLMAGDLLADARAKIGGPLQVRPVDPAADHAALRRLALWATCYTPAVSAWGEENGADGLFLDVTGSAHLFGGEEKLLAALLGRLKRFGLPARLAVADTPGAAWALSHFHRSSTAALPSGQEAAALAPLPIEALRLSPDTRATLRRLGFKRVGALLDNPRAPFAARFPAELLSSLDQALGRLPEALAFLALPPAYHSLRQLLEPISTQEAIVLGSSQLMQDIVPGLERDGMGARNLRLSLYRIDGEVVTVDIGLAMPTRSPEHVARLIDLRLERIVETIDAGFGFEALSLTVTVPERMVPKQVELASAGEAADRAERCAALVDGLRQRLGPHSVRQLRPVASHLPERSEAARVPTETVPAWPAPYTDRLRPTLLLSRAEPAEVTALVPDGPPRRFVWRGVLHAVTRAQGPERIASEWWRTSASLPTRDYYVVENDAGRRFWLYREGLYGRETAAPRWFVHGLFA
jgi:protein ImuB